MTRCAEVITVFALMIGALFPIIHLGRPWLAFWLVPYPSERLIWPNFRSPLVWDFFAINTYLTGSVLFLFLPMIPDFAVVRDKSTGSAAADLPACWRSGWRGTPKQWHRLETAMSIMAVAIIPVAVSVHTIVSFDFSMAPVPMWQSTIFGPYFVAGAIFSGIAGLIIAMAVLRKFLHLEAYLQPVHFENLGKLLLVMALLWGYFVFNERLVTYYGNEPAEMAVFWRTQRESFAPLYWTMVICNFVLPLILMGIRQVPHDHRLRHRVARRRHRHVARAVPHHRAVARPQVPAVQLRHLPSAAGRDHRSPAATFAAMALLYVLFAKVVPIISIWELKARGAPTPALVPPATARASARGGATVKAVYALYADGHAAQQAVEPAAGRRARPTATSPCSRREPMEEFEFGHMRQGAPGCGGSPAAAALIGMATALRAGVDHRDVVADQRRRPADLRVVAEPDHHVRADDARRDPRDGDHAGGDRRLRPRQGEALRPGGVRRQDPGRRREPARTRALASSNRRSACRPTRRSRPSEPRPQRDRVATPRTGITIVGNSGSLVVTTTDRSIRPAGNLSGLINAVTL